MSADSTPAARATATDQVIFGLNAIGKAVNLHDREVTKRWIKQEGLPAAKIGRIWVSHQQDIVEWVRSRIAESGRAA